MSDASSILKWNEVISWFNDLENFKNIHEHSSKVLKLGRLFFLNLNRNLEKQDFGNKNSRLLWGNRLLKNTKQILIYIFNRLSDNVNTFQNLLFVNYQRRCKSNNITMSRFCKQSIFFKSQTHIPSCFSAYCGFYYYSI